ncbi:MAG: PIG-L family deacetylase [Verrucomicrobiota bacterium]
MKTKNNIILAIGAHPDDLELFCGGTLVRSLRTGHRVAMAFVCRGDKGGPPGRNKTIAHIRAREAKKAAHIIGAESLSLGFKDSEILPTMHLRRCMVDLIRRIQPDVLLTHFPSDYHADHRVVSQCVTDAAYIASSPGFQTRHAPWAHIPVLYYFDSLMGIGFLPTEYVDISAVIGTKIAMIKCHQSQFQHLRQRGNLDILTLARDTAKFRGWQAGVQYAEAFQICSAWPNIKTTRILP